MRALYFRELLVMTRQSAFTVAGCAFVLALAAFAATWPAGVPVHAGSTLLPQLLTAEQLVIAVIAPWVVCRCGTRERGNDLVHLSLFSAVRPSRILLARFAAGATALFLLSVGAAPVVVYAQQVAAAEMDTVIPALVATIGVIGAAVAWALVCEQSLETPVASWLAATTATLVLFTAAVLDRDAIVLGTIGFLLSIGVLLAIARRADVKSRYLIEEAV